jgi:hypothetical protein
MTALQRFSVFDASNIEVAASTAESSATSVEYIWQLPAYPLC